jgi:hypothetical protein
MDGGGGEVLTEVYKWNAVMLSLRGIQLSALRKITINSDQNESKWAHWGKEGINPKCDHLMMIET